MSGIPHRPFGRFMRRKESVTDVYHTAVSRHRVEVEVRPPSAEVHFSDDWTANPADTQTRFEAVVYNSDQGFLWEVRSPDGSPGQGTIDASGVYHAPAKGAIQSGTTDIVVVTAREDRLRKAFAFVTLVGTGPEPVTPPSLDISPKRLDLYYRTGFNNNYIDESNKMRVFNAILRDSADTIQWFVNGVFQSAGSSFLYQAPNAGGTTTVSVRAQMQTDPTVFDETEVLLLNYVWPGV